MNAAIVSLPLIVVLALIAAGHWIAIAQTPQPACGSAVMQDQIRSAMFVALDEAFREQFATLHVVMMKEHSRGSVERARTGVDLAVNGYLHSYRAVENWKLPPC